MRQGVIAMRGTAAARAVGRYASSMITPSPTSRIEPHLARGIFEGTVPATATRPECVRITFPNTSYDLHLVPTGPVGAALGKRVIGVVRARARRVDVVGTGGRYVEPVYGRPQRVQGTVIGADASANTITVQAGVPIVCELTDPRQKAGQFEIGAFVSFDVLEGASFTEQG